MPKAVIIENDIWKEVLEGAQPKNPFKSQPMPCAVGLELNQKAWDALDADPLLLMKVTDAASDCYKKTVRNLIAEMKSHDQRLSKSVSDARDHAFIMQSFQKAVKSELEGLEKAGKAQAYAAWDKVAKDKSDYRAYKVKAYCSVAFTAAKVLVLPAVVVPTGGIAIFNAILGGLQGAASIARTLNNLWSDVDTMRGKVAAGVTKLQRAHDAKKKNLKSLAAKDLRNAAANTLFGADFMTTVAGTIKDNKEYGTKLKKLENEAHKYAADLNVVLKKIDTAKKLPEMDNAKSKAELAKVASEVNGLIGDIIGLQEKIGHGNTFCANNASALEEIKKKDIGKWKYLQTGINVLIMGAGTGIDYAVNTKKAVDAAEKAIAAIDTVRGAA